MPPRGAPVNAPVDSPAAVVAGVAPNHTLT